MHEERDPHGATKIAKHPSHHFNPEGHRMTTRTIAGVAEIEALPEDAAVARPLAAVARQKRPGVEAVLAIVVGMVPDTAQSQHRHTAHSQHSHSIVTVQSHSIDIAPNPNPTAVTGKSHSNSHRAVTQHSHSTVAGVISEAKMRHRSWCTDEHVSTRPPRRARTSANS